MLKEHMADLQPLTGELYNAAHVLLCTWCIVFTPADILKTIKTFKHCRRADPSVCIIHAKVHTVKHTKLLHKNLRGGVWGAGLLTK